MRDKNSAVLLALSPCFLIQKYLPLAGIDLGLSLENLSSAFWLGLTSLARSTL